MQIQVQSLSIPFFGIADVTTSAGSIATLKCVLEDNLSANSVEWHKSSSLDVSWPNEQIFENDRVKTGSENGSTFTLTIASVESMIFTFWLTALFDRFEQKMFLPLMLVSIS